MLTNQQCGVSIGTNILISLDGFIEKIECLISGDAVITYNFNTNELIESCIEIYSGFIVDKVIKINLENTSLTCTENSLLYTDKGLASFDTEKAEQFLENETCIPLEVGLKILTKDGIYEEISSIEEIYEDTMVVSPIINHYYNYFANGLLVYNKDVV